MNRSRGRTVSVWMVMLHVGGLLTPGAIHAQPRSDIDSTRYSNPIADQLEQAAERLARDPQHYREAASAYEQAATSAAGRIPARPISSPTRRASTTRPATPRPPFACCSTWPISRSRTVASSRPPTHARACRSVRFGAKLALPRRRTRPSSVAHSCPPDR